MKTEEIDEQIGVWVKRAQAAYLKTEQFEEDKLRLNLQKNSREVYECRGRIQGNYPIYLPPNSILSEKMVMAAHRRTLHGGDGVTVAVIRSRYWIPRLRQLAKLMIKDVMGVNDFKLSLMLTLQLEICQRTEQKEVCLFKSLGWILQDQLHTEQKVTKMERHISFCSHVVLQEQFIWSYYQTRPWRNSFKA